MASIYDNSIQSTLRYYNAHARDYLELGRGGEEAALRIFRQILGKMGSNPKLIDVGCGTGRLNETLRHLEPHQYIGVDPSAGMLELARQHYSGKDFRMGFIADLPRIVPEKVDGFICMNVFVHLPPSLASKAIETLRGTLRPGGIGFVMTYATLGATKVEKKSLGPHRILYVSWNNGDLTERLESAGFKIVEPTFLQYEGELPSSFMTVQAV